MSNGDNNPTNVPALVGKTDRLYDLILELREVQDQVRTKIASFKHFEGKDLKKKESDSDKERKEKFIHSSIDDKLLIIISGFGCCIREEGLTLDKLRELV